MFGWSAYATADTSPNMVNVYLEAECANVGSQWNTNNDGAASNGQYIVFPSGTYINVPPPDNGNNRVYFSFDVPTTDTYYLFGRARTPNSKDDSFWYRVDGGNWNKWDATWPFDGNFNWSEAVGSPFNLSAGDHTIELTYRQDGAQLDKLLISSESAVPTSTGPVGENCGGGGGNQLPNAVAQANPTSGEAPLTVNLDGTNSTDPDGTIATYKWTYTENGQTVTINNDAEPVVNLTEVKTYSITLTVTDNDGGTDTDVVSVVVNQSTPGNVGLYLEAECANVGSQWNIVSDGAASNSQYIVFPSGTYINNPPPDNGNNRVFFIFDLPSAGNYFLFGRARTPSSADDSFWYRIDNSTWIKWDGTWPFDGDFNWAQATGSPFNLAAGNHILELTYRQDGTQLDKLFISNQNNMPSGIGPVGQNCNGTSNQSPNAVAQANPTSGEAPLAVNLDGTNSNDPDGNITSYQWTYTENGQTVTIANNATPTVTLTQVKTYDITLTVTDNEGAIDVDIVSVTVTSGGGGGDPVGIYLEAECADVGSQWNVVNDGAASNGQYVVYTNGTYVAQPPPDNGQNRIYFDFDIPSTGTYYLFGRARTPSSIDDSFWYRIDGGTWFKWDATWPFNGNFNWAEAVGSPFNLSAGNHTIELTYRQDGAQLDKLFISNEDVAPTGTGPVGDNCGGGGSNNQSPNAVAQADPTNGTAPLTVSLDGTDSSDPDGNIVTYRWTYLENGQTVTINNNATPTVTLTQVKTYSITLTVTDDEGATDTDVVSVTVTSGGGGGTGTVALEAECARVGENWNVNNDSDASGGKFVTFPQGNSTAAPPPAGIALKPPNPNVTGNEVWNESNGLLVIEMEHGKLTGDWKIGENFGSDPNEEFIAWTGTQTFNSAVGGVVQYKIKINNPGTYRFLWHVGVGKGNQTSEHNDTWLKINASNFFAKRGTSQLKPKPVCASTPAYDCPQGGSVDNYFKIYGGELNDFVWESQTSDRDAHPVFATFNSAGMYTITISSRSSYNLLDRMILYNTATVSQAFATSPSRPESQVTGGAADNGGFNYNVPGAPVNYVTFDVNVPQSGSYYLFARGGAPSTGDDSFWFRVNGGTWIEYTVPGGAEFTWGRVRNTPFSLSAGTTHTVEVAYREDDAKLDKIQLSTTNQIPTGFGSASSNCNSNFVASNRELGDISAEDADKLPMLTDDQVRLYPNPATDRVQVELPYLDRTEIQMTLRGTLGEVIWNQRLGAGTTKHDFAVDRLPPGVYTLEMRTTNARVTRRIVVTR